jgi:hypothetical protein
MVAKQALVHDPNGCDGTVHCAALSSIISTTPASFSSATAAAAAVAWGIHCEGPEAVVAAAAAAAAAACRWLLLLLLLLLVPPPPFSCRLENSEGSIGGHCNQQMTTNRCL